ncbi:ABC transporter permease [Heliobacterium undosum]|uniref:Transport permease protein n=1 Tax=Heliomicrobium undosum TaxID=121734 RepID=A0A845KZI9_9FIRM|nr:ABC transporter permease [Heliomicrobium undosum]MZP29512.1 ABC transporter permease [Heliomicrobium undosum]
MARGSHRGFIWYGQEAISLLFRHRELIWQMAKREINDRYAGSIFGAAWAVFHPLMLLSVYLVIFSYVFQIKFGGTREIPLDYTAYIIVGFLPWMAIQEILIKSCVAVNSSANLVKQVVFPVEVLPVKGVFATLISQLIGMIFLIVYILIKTQTLPWTILFLPLLLSLQILMMTGLGFILSAIGCYFKDIKDVMQVLTVIGVYLIPVFYLPDWVPDLLKPLLYINPFSYTIWAYQDALFYGGFEHPWAWFIFACISIGMFYFGYRLFRKVKNYFGDVL